VSERVDGHEAIQELSGAAALRALTPDEARFVRAHLATCATCRRAYAELFAVADALLRVPEPVTPPAALRQRILELAVQTPQEAGPPATTSPIAEHPPAGESQPPARHPAPYPAEMARQGTPAPESSSTIPRRRFDWRDLGLVASLAATLFFGWTTLRLQTELQDQRTRLAQTEPVVRAAAAGRVVAIAGTTQAPQVRGALAESAGRADLYLEALPKPPDDRVYQVWLIPPGGQPIGAGVSEPGQGGTQVIPLDRPLTGIELIAVTQEPAPRGSLGPTTPILASARL
jgi:anti-sigma-K factor RskA